MYDCIAEPILISKLKRKIKRITKQLLFPATKPPQARAPKRKQEYSIGILTGDSPLHWRAPANVDNPILTREDVSDVPARIVADPFMLNVKGTWYMFFEVWNGQSNKGEIALATSQDGLKWTYQQIVLAETFHLSYPYVFEWMNDYYLIPEAQQAEAIRLYRASPFPSAWSCVATLMSRPLSEAHLADPSIFRHDGRWWLFIRTNPRSKPAALCLYYADDLVGPWREHRSSPVVKGNIHITRPAGRVLSFNGK